MCMVGMHACMCACMHLVPKRLAAQANPTDEPPEFVHTQPHPFTPLAQLEVVEFSCMHVYMHACVYA